jgi:hypothetical protein
MNTNGTFSFGSGKIETGIGPTVDGIINFILKKLEVDQVKNKISDNILCPAMDMINQKIRPYVYISLGLYLIIVVLLVVIFYILVNLYRKNIR